jgi:ATP-binding cassette subfamily F protein uup
VPVLSVRQLSKAFGPQTLFENISLTVTRGERVGLVGINGTGKSTLLKVLAGVEPPDTGTIERRRDSNTLYLPQEPRLDGALSPRQIVESGLAAWKTATLRYGEVSEQLGTAADPTALLDEQANLVDRIEQLGGWERGHEVLDMLQKLGVLELDRPVGNMSGGEQRRVALAHLLVARPTLAILDEPTNHLDADTIAWLEGYLSDEYPGAVLVVTHDRYFLDALCDRMLELDRKCLIEYQGGYTSYLEQKAERLAHEDRTQQNRLNLLRREQAWLQRGAKARSTKQKARIQRAEALISNEPMRTPRSVELEALAVEAPRTGKTVLNLENLTLGIGGRQLVRDLSLHLTSGERVGVVGVNGAGKTSLLRAIMGELAPLAGRVQIGAQTRVALFDQSRAGLIDEWSIYDNVAERQGAERDSAFVVQLGERTLDLRTYLEYFLFEGSAQRKPVGALSGGERARVALAKILKQGANLLLLDEPTNDLDVATLSALEELVVEFSGSAVIVSHDRGFLDRVATSLLVFEGEGNVVRYPGNYSTYRSLKSAREQALALEAKSKPPPAAAASKPAARTAAEPVAPEKRALSSSERRELNGIVDKIGEAEQRIAELEKQLGDPTLYATRAAEAQTLSAELTRSQAALGELMTRWEALEARRNN